MNLHEIPTPETDAIYGNKPEGVAEYIGEKTHRDLERRLTIARTALESITHDMGASKEIHQLAADTLTATAPKP